MTLAHLNYRYEKSSFRCQTTFLTGHKAKIGRPELRKVRTVFFTFFRHSRLAIVRFGRVLVEMDVGLGYRRWSDNTSLHSTYVDGQSSNRCWRIHDASIVAIRQCWLESCCVAQTTSLCFSPQHLNHAQSPAPTHYRDVTGGVLLPSGKDSTHCNNALEKTWLAFIHFPIVLIKLSNHFPNTFYFAILYSSSSKLI